MDIRERIMLIRKESKLTQQAFADTIGVSVGVISNIELGRAPVTRVVGIAICSKFHIREEWLFDGVGDMYEADDLVETLADRSHMNAKQRALLRTFASLTPEEAEVLFRFAQKVVDDRESQQSSLPPVTAADLAPYMLPDQDKQKKLG